MAAIRLPLECPAHPVRAAEQGGQLASLDAAIAAINRIRWITSNGDRNAVLDVHIYCTGRVTETAKALVSRYQCASLAETEFVLLVTLIRLTRRCPIRPFGIPVMAPVPTRAVLPRDIDYVKAAQHYRAFDLTGL